MTCHTKLFICSVVVGLMCARANALPTNHPYETIVVANVFRLRPPPAPEIPATNTPPPPKIIPNGILTFGEKRVLFKVQILPRPPLPASERFYILAEGQREDDIEVLQINEKTGTIVFNNHGLMTTLIIDSTAPKLADPTGVGLPAAELGNIHLSKGSERWTFPPPPSSP
jgi:hypothetical protein